MRIPRRPQPRLPGQGLDAARRLEAGVPRVLLVRAGDAGEDGDDVLPFRVHMPPGVVEGPQFVKDLLADLEGEPVEEG